MTKSRTVEHELSFPIEQEGKPTVTKVTIRRPKGRTLREIEAMEEEGYSASARILTMLSDLDAEQIDEMDVEDFDTLSGIIEGFFPKPPAGEAGAES